MNQLAVWFNVVAFALLFCAFSLSFLGYLADRKPWARSYLVYLASYAFWLVLATWYYFRVTFVPAADTTIDLVVGYVRIGVSLVIGYVTPLMVIQIDQGKARGKTLAILFVVPAAIASVIAVYLATGIAWINAALNIAFNAFQASIAVWGLRVLRRATPDPRAASLRAFFRLSIVLYALLVLYRAVTLLVSAPVVPVVGTLLTGLFGLAWSVLVIVDQVRAARSRTANDGLPSTFLREYRITERERGIIRVLGRGSTTKEIGHELFVSPRTVETHLRNVYRKCGVTNRVELLSLVESCRARSDIGVRRTT